MGIAEADVARVRAATDIAGLIGEHTGLKRVGRRYVGLCPFHSEKSGSFSVNAEEGLYYCFGCQTKGDAITFVRAIEGCGFVEAVERLAARAGLSVEVTDDPLERAERGQRRRLAEVLAQAVDWYHTVLLQAPEAGAARQYLRGRGYDGDTVRTFRLGYAPAGRDALVRAVSAPTALLVEAGLAWTSSQGRPGDIFRERVIFPIFDVGGHPIALGGRILPEALRKPGPGGRPSDPGPKYRNSAESPIYSKRRTLYGLNWAKGEISRSGEVVVCEGYTDVIGCFRAGVGRAVATCGTALTEDHVKVLANFAKRVVLCFDADAAGQNAAARLYEWERRHAVELAVAALPAGSDPGELSERDPVALSQAIGEARPFLAFVVERALASADLSSPEGRARAVRAALGALAEHPDELVRDQYVLLIADRTRNEPERLRAELEALRSGRGSPAVGEPHPSAAQRGARDADGWEDVQVAPQPAAGPRGGARPAAPREAERGLPGRHVLLFAIHRPDELAALLDDGVLDTALFPDDVQRRAFEVLARAEELHEAIAQADPDSADLLAELAVGDVPEGVNAEDAVLALARTAAERALARAGAEARLAERDDDLDRHARASDDSRMLAELLRPLRDPLEAGGTAARDAAAALVAWLTQQEVA